MTRRSFPPVLLVAISGILVFCGCGESQREQIERQAAKRQQQIAEVAAQDEFTRAVDLCTIDLLRGIDFHYSNACSTLRSMIEDG